MKPRLAPGLPPAQRHESWTDTSFLTVAALGGGQAAQLVRHVYSDMNCDLYLAVYSFMQKTFLRRFFQNGGPRACREVLRNSRQSCVIINFAN